MKTYIFEAKQRVEADSLEEAKMKFADNSMDFASNAVAYPEEEEEYKLLAVSKDSIKTILEIDQEITDIEMDKIMSHLEDTLMMHDQPNDLLWHNKDAIEDIIN